MGPRGRFYPYLYHCDYIGLLGTSFMQVWYLGRAPRTKETLPDFHEKCRVTRHSREFRGLTGSQQTPGFWGVTADGLSTTVKRSSSNTHASTSAAYQQSLLPVVISLPLPLCSCELARIREPWRKIVRGLWNQFSAMAVGVVCSNIISVETN